MSQTLQTASVNKLELGELIKSDADPLSMIVKDYGIVYVTAITRDGCSGCEEQKPLFLELATRIQDQNPRKATFSDLHIQYTDGDPRQSEQAKRLFRHGSYPTYMIHIKSHYGPLEHYRAAYPSMQELEKQIIDAFELAEFYIKRTQGPA